MLAGKIGLVILLGVAVTQVLTENCDAHAVLERYLSCTQSQIGISDATKATKFVIDLCQNFECAIKCMTDKVGTCFKTDGSFIYDPVVFKVSSRVMCNHKQKMLDVLELCSTHIFENNACFSTFVDQFANSYEDFLDGNYSSYKTAACNAFNTLVGCFESDPIMASGTCTSDLAAFATDVFVVSYSYSECGIAQTHDYFTTYAGDITCGANRVAMTMAYVISALIFVF
ncbi:uncharacterized protein LOC127832168 [Dreissena polymorpha]|uniref:Uncharacterized protein n=1 Tax=Dreissena polymorpha TaxID=45954 RepID=A0A9D4H5U5_DREPO|nr:uncharacterized protein LOC127832168 [Dreissena polymorpha]KAH3829118.1 hypothetical protein DPMN_131106 [Dreissena polymorpha]